MLQQQHALSRCFGHAALQRICCHLSMFCTRDAPWYQGSAFIAGVSLVLHVMHLFVQVHTAGLAAPMVHEQRLGVNCVVFMRSATSGPVSRSIIFTLSSVELCAVPCCGWPASRTLCSEICCCGQLVPGML
jgi:hypothetical protein